MQIEVGWGGPPTHFFKTFTPYVYNVYNSARCSNGTKIPHPYRGTGSFRPSIRPSLWYWVGSLRPWLWSVDVGLLLSFNPELHCRPMDEAGEKVTPSALPAFCAEGFRRPCCLCSVPGLDSIGIGYKESAVCMNIGEVHFGEYIIRCADRKCGYKGVFCYWMLSGPMMVAAVHIEQSYTIPGLPMKWFRRAQNRSWCLHHCKASTNPYRHWSWFDEQMQEGSKCRNQGVNWCSQR